LLRLVLGMATLLILLAVTAGLWWWVPARPWGVIHPPAPCLRVAASANGRTLASVHPESVILWDLPSGTQRKSTAIDWGRFNNINPSSPLHSDDYDHAFSLSDDGTIAVWKEKGAAGISPPQRFVKFWNSVSDRGPEVISGARGYGDFVGNNLEIFRDQSMIL